MKTTTFLILAGAAGVIWYLYGKKQTALANKVYFDEYGQPCVPANFNCNNVTQNAWINAPSNYSFLSDIAF